MNFIKLPSGIYLNIDSIASVGARGGWYTTIGVDQDIILSKEDGEALCRYLEERSYVICRGPDED